MQIKIEKELHEKSTDSIINSTGGDVVKTPIGVEDYTELIISGEFYVDKTLMLKNLIDTRDKLLVFPRPRRFGKTLCLSMIDNYFNVTKDSKELFSNLNISKCGDKYLSEMNKYPVINLDLKELSCNNFEKSYSCIKNKLSVIYGSHSYLYNSLEEFEKKYFDKILNEEGSYGNNCNALHRLSLFLHKYYNEKVIILIDEYDAIMQNGYINDYLSDANDFMNIFLGEALKTNEHLKFGVLTGVLQTGKDSLLSKLNNGVVYSCSNSKYSEFFGFTHEEVMDALDQAELTHLKEDVEAWYDGYKFGGRKIYNPWSINNFLGSNGSFDPYWVNTGQTAILASMFKSDSAKVLQRLLNGENVLCKLNENVVYSLINNDIEYLLNFCYMAGYLTIEKQEDDYVYFKIPNHEVKKAFKVVASSFVKKFTLPDELNFFNSSIISNDKSLLEETLNSILLSYVSYHDSIEYFYHGLCLGLLVSFGHDYIVKSNRESGYGRYDALLYKKDLSFGCIFEFKVAKENDDLEEKIKEASLQIKEKKYIEELENLGIKNICTYSIAFNKKECIVR